MKVMVLGAGGMIGHKIAQVLSEDGFYHVIKVSRTRTSDDVEVADLRSLDCLITLIKHHGPAVVVNAAGVLIEEAETDPLSAVETNALLPLRLNGLSKDFGFKFIHLSTDCVFSGDAGPYAVDDAVDARTIYGRTKGLSERLYPENLVIRTSVIGPDLKVTGGELFSWFARQSGRVNGYTESIWSGVTTIRLAQLLGSAIKGGLSGVHHLSCETPICKADLLQIINKFMMSPTKILKVPGIVSNKALIPDRSSIFCVTEPYSVLVEEMIDDILKTNLYPHYSVIKR